MTKRNETRVEAIKYLDIYGPSTAQQIGEGLKRNHSPIYYALRRAHTNKLVHIKRYDRNEEHKVKRADWLIVWGKGPGKDAPKPGPMTSAEEAARYYKRHKPKIALKARLKHNGKPVHPWLITLNFKGRVG